MLAQYLGLTAQFVAIAVENEPSFDQKIARSVNVETAAKFLSTIMIGSPACRSSRTMRQICSLQAAPILPWLRVENQQRRIGHEGATDSGHLLLAARELLAAMSPSRTS